MREHTFKKLGLSGLISLFIFLCIPYNVNAQFNAGERPLPDEEAAQRRPEYVLESVHFEAQDSREDFDYKDITTTTGFDDDIDIIDTDQDGQPDVRIVYSDYRTGQRSIQILNPADDLDSDGLLDKWEEKYGVNPSDTKADPDSDGLTNIWECILDTHPNNPDTDADGVDDYQDVFPLTPAESQDTDGDGIGDNADLDDDNDNLPDVSDADPRVIDADNDGLMNWDELNPHIDIQFQTDSNKQDTDNDGIWDGVDEFPNDSTKPEGMIAIVNHTNNDPQGLANGLNILFVNPYSPNWVEPHPNDPQRRQKIRQQALNPATPAPSLEALMNVSYGVLQPQDTVLLRGGVHYLGGSSYSQRTGSQDQPVTIKSYPEEKAILTNMIIARGWESYLVNNKQCYKKSFMKNYFSILQNNVPLTGYNGSLWRIYKDSLSPYNNVGVYISQSPMHKHSVGTYPNSPPWKTTTTFIIALPDGEAPDVNNVVRVGSGGILHFYGPEPPSGQLPQESCYVLEDLTFMYADIGVNISQYSTVTVRNCIFENLTGQGILIGKNSHANIEKSYFENIGSTKWDHGIYAAGIDTQIHHNRFFNISGGAIHIYNSAVIPRNNQVWNNLIGQAKAVVFNNDGKVGIYDWGRESLIYNNIIFGHHNSGVSFNNGNGKFYHNTIVGANCSLYIGQQASGKVIKNNLLVINGLPFDFFVSSYADLLANTLDYNLYYSLSGNYKFYLSAPGSSFTDFITYQDVMQTYRQEIYSFYEDPLFREIAAGDFHLLVGSPAIDRAETLPEVTEDFDGLPRIGNYDIGAFEYQVHTITATAGPGGRITPQGQVLVGHGEDKTFYINPSPGYFISSFLVDSGPETPVTEYTFYDVTSNHTIAATFALGNQPPTLAPIGNKTVEAGQTLGFTISTTDPDGDTLHCSATGLPQGAALRSQARFITTMSPNDHTFTATNDGSSEIVGTFSWTPTHAQIRTHSVTFTVTDGQAEDSETITITVTGAPATPTPPTPTNHPPKLGCPGNQTVYQGNTLSFTVTGTDEDGDTLEFIDKMIPSGATFNVSPRSGPGKITGTFSWPTTSSTQATLYRVGFRVWDGHTVVGTSTVIEVKEDPNPPPTPGPSPSPNPEPNPEPSPEPEPSPTPKPEPSPSPKPNQPPILKFDPPIYGEQTAYIGETFKLYLTAEDPDEDALTYVRIRLPKGATLTVSPSDPNKATFEFTPTSEQIDFCYTLEFRVSDGQAVCSKPVVIRIKEAN